jgi:hypothetical protein
MLTLACAVILSTPPRVNYRIRWPRSLDSWKPPFKVWSSPNADQVVHLEFEQGGYLHKVDITVHSVPGAPEWSAWFRSADRTEAPAKYVVVVGENVWSDGDVYNLEINETHEPLAGARVSWIYRSLVTALVDETFTVGEGTHYFVKGSFENGYAKRTVTVVSDGTSSKVYVGPIGSASGGGGSFARPEQPRKWRRGFPAQQE